MRFGLPRSSSPSPVREKPKAKSATAPLKSKRSAPAKDDGKPLSASQSKTIPYRRGTSFGLIDSSSSDSESHSSSDPDIDATSSFHPKEYSSDEEDFGFRGSSASSSGNSSDDSVEFVLSASAGKRLEKLSKTKGKRPAQLLELTPHQSPSGRSREMEEAVASIRLRTRFHDPYEEWEKSTRKEAFRTARKVLSTTQSEIHATRLRLESQEKAKLASQHQSQVDEIQRHLNSLKIQQEREELRSRQELKNRDKQLWDRIEKVISIEEGKVRSRLEEERKRKEEEERARQEAEEKKRQEEEKARKAKEEKEEAARKVKEEEERKKREEDDRRKQEEEEERKLEEAAQKAAEARRLSDEARSVLGYRTAEEEWTQARISLLQLKDSVLAPVKADKEAKKAFNAIRRQITPKVGQLTNDEESINRISTQLRQLLSPNPPLPPPIYAGLCSSLAKAIILQAETEVTAEKKAAIPLARVTFNLLTSLDAVFREVFWTKLVQRTGGWVIPSIVPGQTDVDGRKWGEGPKGRGRGRGKGVLKGASDSTAERRMVMGYRLSESTSAEAQLESAGEYSQRISGIVRVYWEIVKVQLRFPDRAFMDGPGSGQRVDPTQPQEAQANLQSPFGINRFWVWFARMAAVRPFLETGVGASLVHVALDVMGAEAADIWGWQWVKVLELVYEGATNGLYPERGPPPPLLAGHQELIHKKDVDGERENVTIGGNTPDGRAARARVQMEVERIVGGERKAL